MTVGDVPGGSDLPRRVQRLEQRQELLEHHYQVADNELSDLEQRQRGMSRLLQAIVTTQSEHTAALRTLTERVDGLGVKLEEHDRRFDGIDARLDGHDARFDAVDQRFDAVDQRFDGIDTQLADIRGQLSTVIGMLAGPPRGS